MLPRFSLPIHALVILIISQIVGGCYLNSSITSLNETPSLSDNPVLTDLNNAGKDFTASSQFKMRSQSRNYTVSGFFGHKTEKTIGRSGRGYTLEYSVEVLSK